MMKYFYFAVVDFKEVAAAGSGLTKRRPVTTYGKGVYSNAALAIVANIGWICNHVGSRFVIAGFEHQLSLNPDHTADGFVAVDDDSIVISGDLKGLIALLKKNLKLCNVKL